MQQQIQALAQKYGFSEGAVSVLMRAMQMTGAKSAQFNHPEFGGMGQWMPGMVMIGDMFNNALQGRIAGLCAELAVVLTDIPTEPFHTTWVERTMWWPAEFGSPDVSGGQNDLHYAYFAPHNRLMVKRGTIITTYDTTGFKITGIMQQQSGGSATLICTGPQGNTKPEQFKVV